MTSSPNSRRRFLGTLGKAIGAGGLLLPWAGKGALALPADLGAAASLPVTAAPLPFSVEALRLREIRDAMHRIHMTRGTAGQDERSREWCSLMVDHYAPAARTIAARAEPTMTDCVELAEIIWHYLPKEQVQVRKGEWEYHDDTGALAVAGDRHTVHYFGGNAYQCRDAIVALVEAVLTIGAGERRDPKTPEGYYPQVTRARGTP